MVVCGSLWGSVVFSASLCSFGLFSKGLKNEFETAMVNESSVFKPLKFYSNMISAMLHIIREAS